MFFDGSKIEKPEPKAGLLYVDLPILQSSIDRHSVLHTYRLTRCFAGINVGSFLITRIASSSISLSTPRAIVTELTFPFSQLQLTHLTWIHLASQFWEFKFLPMCFMISG